MAKFLYRAIISLLKIAELCLLCIIACNMWVYAVTNGKTYRKVSKIPPRDTAIILGTSPKTKAGNANADFLARMEAAALLYHHGKIKHILVSGEKSRGYDEPAAMKNFLIYEGGIPEHVIQEDSQGYNTSKSITRAKSIYHLDNVIIISQGYHNLRALFFARNIEMNALGFDARDISRSESFYRNQSREVLARVQAVLYYILNIPD